jgi:hypothetical protein
MINKHLCSVHLFLYYEINPVGLWLLEKLSSFYDGKVFLSLVKNNENNTDLLKAAENLFEIDVTYVNNYGTDQIGFCNTFPKDTLETDWVIFLHDKHYTKIQWLNNLIEPLRYVDLNSLNNIENIGIISSSKHKCKVQSINSLLNEQGNMFIENRKSLVESMHTVIWLKELQRMLLETHNLISEDDIYPTFCAGNIFLAKKDVVRIAHSCIYEKFFNKNYRADGEVEHGLERFYFYVSKCMGYDNLFI